MSGKRGRPRGEGTQGARTRAMLFETAIRAFGAEGYEASTLRGIAKQAGVSPGLLYRYFPSKRAVVLALYAELSSEYASRAAPLPQGGWPTRFGHALEVSLATLAPHRDLLASLLGVLLADPEHGVLGPGTAASRASVLQIFLDAVTEASNAPSEGAEALGRLLYALHLALILAWLLDRSPRQVASRSLRAWVDKALAWAPRWLALPPARRVVLGLDEILRSGFLEPDAS